MVEKSFLILDLFWFDFFLQKLPLHINIWREIVCKRGDSLPRPQRHHHRRHRRPWQPETRALRRMPVSTVGRLYGTWVHFFNVISFFPATIRPHDGKLRENLIEFGQYVAQCLPKFVQKVLVTGTEELEVIDWLIGWSIDWLIDWSIDWSIDWWNFAFCRSSSRRKESYRWRCFWKITTTVCFRIWSTSRWWMSRLASIDSKYALGAFDQLSMPLLCFYSPFTLPNFYPYSRSSITFYPYNTTPVSGWRRTQTNSLRWIQSHR